MLFRKRVPVKKTMKKIGKTNFSRGFTLIELMAATAIMIILVMFVTNIAVNMLRIYDKTIATLSTHADSAMVLDPVQDDLRAASMPQDGKYWFEVRYDSGSLDNLKKAAVPEFYFFSHPSDRIRREKNSTDTLPGDLCAISYKIAHTSPFGSKYTSNAGNLVYGFYRAVLNASDTFEYAVPYIIGQKSTSESSCIPSKFWKGSDQITDPSDSTGYTASAWRTEMQNFLIDGIVNFSVFFWFDDFSDGKRKIVTVSDSTTVQRLRNVYPDTTILTFDKTLFASMGAIVLDENFSGKTSGALRSAEVSITVLSPDGKEILAAKQESAGTGKIDEDTFEDILTEYGETFSRSCELFGGS